MTLPGNPTRKRGLKRIFLAYASGYQVFKQHHFVPAALVLCQFAVIRTIRSGLVAVAADDLAIAN